VEHSAVLQAARTHAATGGRTASIGVDRLGRVDAAEFIAAARAPDVTVAALQAANHEVGTRQPVTAVAEQLGDLPLIVDASPALAHADVPAGWSVLGADARAWGAPAGVGILAVRTGVRWQNPYPPDDGSGERLPGPLPVPAVVAAAAALRAATDAARSESVRLSGLVDRIRSVVPARIPDVELVGDPDERLPHIVTFSCLYADGEALLSGLDRHGFAVSSGSSCTSSTLTPSHVLVAMGALSSGNVRVSLSYATSEAEVDEFLAVLPGIVAQVRAELGASGL
jgi:cysteine desulfurase